MPEEPRFGRYRVTDHTLVRAHRPTFAPAFTLNDDVYDDLRTVERADHELAKIPIDAVERRRNLEGALARNAYGTASIEGNPLTLEDVEGLLERGPSPDPDMHPDEREILNYARVIERIDAHPPPRQVDDILDLHAELFDGVLDDAGSFKETPNFIGKRPEYEVVYIPTAPEHVAEELENALEWLHTAGEHPLVRVAVFFHEFQSIHPFRDGNGRTGRALSTIFLHHLGYTGVRYALIDYAFNEDRDSYYAALQQVERADFEYTEWLAYFAGVLRESFEAGLDRILFSRRLPFDLNERQVQVAEWFARLDREHPDRRVKFNDVHAAFPQVAERTLKRDLARLRDERVIEMTGQRKGAAYRIARAG